jgi:hypothetical protein
MHYKTQLKEIKDYLTQYGCKVVKTFKIVVNPSQPKATFIVFKELKFNTDYCIELKDIIRCKKGNKKLSKILIYCELYKSN